ncbi:biosynthetic-type acetolactate synthase large subunit [Rudaea sp.]|uniref:biosynthetic-type acetolactate synthase large subunit n=1 Tax=Rudaea sp. TaxID=2136325 RepID=UPI002ECFE6B3
MNAQLKPSQIPNTHPQGTHPLAGKNLSGADIVVQVLADEGVDVVFGYSGGAILPVYDAVFRYNHEHKRTDGSEPLPLIVPANEQGAGFMAQGYARASGKVGVAIVTSGPGATNTVTPVRDAMADSIPIVVICGQVPTAAIGSDGFQEAPISNIMAACAKHVFLVTDAAKLEATLRSAFEIARTGRPGPVVVDIPKDVQNTNLVFDGASRLQLPGYRARLDDIARSALDDEAKKTFFDAFAKAKRPLIYAGGGVIAAEAAQALREFAGAFGIPVVTTLMGIGAADTTQPLSLHMLGMHGTAFANYATEDCDFLIAVGSRFDDRVAGVPNKFAAGAKFIAHLDVDPAEIDKVKRVDWHHLGDLKRALDALREYGLNVFDKGGGSDPKGRGVFANWHAHIAELKKTYAMNFDRKAAVIQPYAVIEEINKHTQGNAVIATGVGQHQMWAAQYFDFCEPRLWLTSGSMGTMGFGLPAAIGAAFARRDAIVIDIDGDASIRMNLGELETVTTYNLPIKVVVLNNFGDGMVRQWQKLFFKGRFSASDKSLHKKDFVKAAQADGFPWAQRLDKPEDLPRVIAEFVAFDGPAFLEVIIDADAGVYPMVGPGMAYAEMITGDFIPSRQKPTGQEVGPAEMF